MRELTYYVATSLDGRIAGPHDDWSAFPTEGDHIAMIVRDWSDTLPAPALRALGLEPDGSHFDAVVMGWNTYAVGLAEGVDDPYPHLEQVVFTRAHPDEHVPAGVRLVTDDPVAEVRRLKQVDGAGIWLCGGGRLAEVLADEVDRLVLKVNPVLLGDGVPLLGPGGYHPRRFHLQVATPYESGVVVLEYVRAVSDAPGTPTT